ncbi:transposase [Gelidibacter maritimus]|uniref:Transposase IS200-like domain-containing protein n=1 Tax=Gelidibacter maritimus TaxID=2761487 RepID=A0A7W2R319_9FLAO|nr:transposase [Gelidibacter maritimus]MBA6152396.1 hypothetical protein [Gelidibacter maritimus]
MTKKFQNKYRIASARLQNWDYGSNAAYFITICTQNRECYFGNIIEQKMMLNNSGQIAENIWYQIPNQFPYVALGDFVVMPNHVHGILMINKPDDIVIANGGSVDDTNSVDDIVSVDDTVLIGENISVDDNVSDDNTVSDDDTVLVGDSVSVDDIVLVDNSISDDNTVSDDDTVETRLIASLPSRAPSRVSPIAPSRAPSTTSSTAPPTASSNKSSNESSTASTFNASSTPSSKPTGGITGNKNPMIHENISRIIRWYKGRCTFEIRKTQPDFGWQSRFHDHIIRNETAFQKITKYIIDNPKNWNADKFYS